MQKPKAPVAKPSTALTLVPVEKIKKDALALIPAATKLPAKITSAQEQVMVEAQRIKDNRGLAAMEEMYERTVGPFSKAVRESQAAFRELKKPLEKRVEQAGLLLSAYIGEQRALAAKLAEKEAAKLEKKGQYDQADAVRDQVANVGGAVTEGTVYVDTFEVVVKKEEAVPAYLNGVELRPVHQAALNRLAQQTEGRVEIPGCEIIKVAKVRSAKK